MAKNLRLAVIVFCMLCATASLCQTTFYVDANFAGSTRNGISSNPWKSLSDSGAWTAINSSLAAGPVTVYFSARNAGTDTNEISTTPLSINRTDMSTNLLTLDGSSQYNTNSTTPLWSVYSGSSHFQITASYPVNVQSGSCTTTQESNYWTLHGFAIVATDGQIVMMSRARHVILENNTFSAQAGTTLGPGILIGCSNLGAAGPAGFAGTDVTIRNNTIHDTYGEAIYAGGWYGCNQTGDGQTNCPNAVNPSGPHSPGAGGPCNTSTTWAGDTLVIQNNTIYNPGEYGGNRQGVDVKDCWYHVTIQNNSFYLTDASGAAPNVGGSGCIITISAATILSNFCHDFEQIGIDISNWYNEYTGYFDGTVIRDNIVVNTALGTNYSYGYGIAATCDKPCATDAVMTNTVIQNNSVYNQHKVSCSGCAAGIFVDSGYANLATFTVQDNIVSTTDGLDLSSSGTNTLGMHGNNLYWNSSGNIINYAGTVYTGATITLFESTSISVNPAFVNTGTPYVDANFQLAADSPALGVGAAISPSFEDYFGTVRVVPWDMGAIAHNTSVPAPPTALKAAVN